MAWPTDAQHTTFSSGVTRIGTSFLGAVQSGVTGVVGGTMPVTRLTVTGNHYLSGAPGGLAASGAIKAVGNIASVSGEVQAPLHASVAGGTGLELRSGSVVRAYHTTATIQISGSTASGAIAVPVTSGKTVSITARGVGVRSNYSGTRVQIITASYCDLDGDGSLTTVQGDFLLASGASPASQPGGILTNALSGAVHIQAIGGSGQINWTIYADVTVSP